MAKYFKNKVDSRKTISINEHLKAVDTGVKDGIFTFTGPLTVGEFCKKINKTASELIKNSFMKGKIINLNTMLNEEQIGEYCLEYGLDFKIENEVLFWNVPELNAS